jgi:hypothetical protein
MSERVDKGEIRCTHLSAKQITANQTHRVHSGAQWG